MGHLEKHCLVTYPKEVPVCIVIEPVVYYHVPGSVVVCIGCGVPPVLKAQLKVLNLIQHNPFYRSILGYQEEMLVEIIARQYNSFHHEIIHSIGLWTFSSVYQDLVLSKSAVVEMMKEKMLTELLGMPGGWICSCKGKMYCPTNHSEFQVKLQTILKHSNEFEP